MRADDLIAAHGFAYGGLALATGFAAAAVPMLAPETEILVLGALLVALAASTLAVALLPSPEPEPPRSPLRFAAGIGAGVATAAVWALVPTLFLLGLLAGAVLAVSRDPEGRAAWWTRIASGIAPVVLPTLLHREEVARLLELLVETGSGDAIAETLAAVVWPAILFVVFAIVWESHRGRGRSALELAGSSALLLLAPPVVAIALHLTLMHAARRGLRAGRDAGIASPAALLALATLPAALALALAGAGLRLPIAAALEPRVLQLLVVALAALAAVRILAGAPVRARAPGPIGFEPGRER